MMCRSSILGVVSIFKIHKIVILVQISLGFQLVTSAAVNGVEIIIHIRIFSNRLRTR